MAVEDGGDAGSEVHALGLFEPHGEPRPRVEVDGRHHVGQVGGELGPEGAVHDDPRVDRSVRVDRLAGRARVGAPRAATHRRGPPPPPRPPAPPRAAAPPPRAPQRPPLRGGGRRAPPGRPPPPPPDAPIPPPRLTPLSK